MNLIGLGILIMVVAGILAWATSIPYLGFIAIVGLIVALVGVWHLVAGPGRY